METIEDHEISKAFLTSDDLFHLRKLSDVPAVERVNEKGYIPQDSDNFHVESLLKDKKNLLEIKNTARIADLIQAEWKPQIRKAVTTKLKGRTQHMGCSLDGKVGLCPEEVILLLERGNLELTYNDVPLSAESAYATVLSGDLAIEKYQVYAYLSRLGFIVVQHQKHIDVSQQEKLHTENRCRCKRKKKQHETAKRNKKIHLETEDSSSSHMETDCDRVSKNFELLVKTSEHIAKIQDSGETASNSVTTDASSIQAENNLPHPTISTNESRNDNKISAVVNKEVDVTVNNSKEILKLNDKKIATVESNTTSTKELEDDLPFSKSSTTTQSQQVDKTQENTEKANSASTTTLKVKENVTNDERELCTKAIETPNESIDSIADEERLSSLTCGKFKSSAEITAGDENVSKAAQRDISKPSSESYIQLDDDESNKSLKDLERAVASKLRSDNEETSDSDILSLYADSDNQSETNDKTFEIVNDDSVQSVADNEAVEVDDVVVLEVNKTKIEPMAVIDLSSDDESNAAETNPVANDDDDEVLIINECRSTKPLRSQGWFKSSYNIKFKKEVIAKSERSIITGPSFPFPNLFKKRVVCLPRPPPHLLPFSICMNKEAYTIDLNTITAPNTFVPVQRVWNSWRDLQDRQSMRNSPGLHSENQRFPLYSAPANNSFSQSVSSPNHHFPTFSNNMTPPSINRFGGPQYEMNMSPNSFQGPLQTFNNSPMGGVMGMNSLPPFNRQPNSCSDEDSKRNIFQRSINPPIFNSPNNENLGTNSWRNLSFNENSGPPNLWPNINPSDNSGSPMPWRNMEPRESFQPFNMQRNAPPMIEFQSPQSPWTNIDRNPNDRFSNPNNFPQNQICFPDQNPQRNFPSPYMENFQPAFNREQINYHGYCQTDNYRHWRQFDNPYPCDIPKVPSSRVSNWQQLKTSNPEADLTTSNDNNQDASEIQEIPIDIDEVLWSKEIHPLVRPDQSLTLDEALKCIQKTTANLFTTSSLKERSIPEGCSIEISFDVYLPKTPYRRSCPAVPNHRIIVTRSSDPFPKLSDIYALTRKFKDSAILQFAVIDNGDIAFYSFSNVYVPMLLP